MTLPVVFTANGPSGYNLTKSLRFRSSASAYLNRTPSTAGNKKTWTYSAWVKRGTLGTSQSIFYATPDGSTVAWNGTNLWFDSNNQLRLQQANSPNTYYVTSAVFRDPSAWYHIVCAVDTTQATAGNRVLIYVNNVLQTLTIPLGSGYAQNDNTWVNGTYEHDISSQNDSPRALYLDGYLTEINFIDGQQLTPSSFGSTNSLTGVWQPAKYTGTYGTNGFYLPFTNTTSTTTLGYDFSGNSNNWTSNNISLTAGTTYDSMTDVPTLTSATTANYPVMNPLDTTGGSITNGNLTVTTTGSNINCRASFVIPTTGKWYFETTDVVTGGNNIVGIANSTLAISASQTGATGSIYTGMFSNAVYGFAFNFDALTYTIYKNNSVDASGSITSGIAYSIFIATSSSGSASTAFNFGQQPFTYTPPTGFVALNTYNLPTSTIVKGNTVMDATTYTGTLLSNAITNTAGFKPDLVWIKSRSAATDNKLTDSVRGTTKGLISNTTGAETTDTQGLTAFGTGGFTVGTNTDYNNLSATYVGWQWQAGQGTTSSNTSGSITSTVSANPTAGFSIVTYTGNGTSGATVGHGLGVAPAMMIIKTRSAVNSWVVYHQSLGNTKGIYLNLTGGADTNSSFWNNTSPSSTVATLGTDTICNQNGTTYVAYCWSQIAGFSKFGSYTGNGSADGPFVYTGFRPKFVLYKRSDSTGDWYIWDTARDTINVAGNGLFPNYSIAEVAYGTILDIVSNGFKLRTNGVVGNSSGATYIYIAFAENPTKFALAR